MPKIVRRHPLLCAFSLAYWISFFIYGVAAGNPNAIVYLTAMGAAFLFVAVTYRTVPFTSGVLWGLGLWGLAHMTGGLVHVDDDVLYGVQLIPVVLRFDQAVHAFGFGFATLAAWQALAAKVSVELPISAGLATLISLAGMGIGALNEVLEFLTTRLSSQSNVGGFVNTGWDLVFNMLGAVAAALYVRATGGGAENVRPPRATARTEPGPAGEETR